MTIKSADAEAQVHLLAIRKALANRNAAVMVGAGFSRNAEGGAALATWRQLAEALARELEPGGTTNDFSPAAASQLAEQYSRVFSPTHLEQLIKRCVPDDQVTPGPLHKDLLELPWAEVFTTNYDTLLEREAERMFDVSYFTVCSREDIPQSKVLGRRRIVKLHGSFPSHRPFILTEEDYRTYPERFAPFVNLVRQSLLENVFCLIGFSGDDPNFLHWLGWVRDMLDKHALPVYLFLSKIPTLGERKLYEARGVVPVLLPVPEGVSPTDFQARYRSLFSELATPLSNSPLDWGKIHYSQQLSQAGDEEASFRHFLEQLPAFVDVRRTYPGWIVAPEPVRTRIKSASDWLEGKLLETRLRRRLEEFPAPVVTAVVDLYGWMQQVALAPLSDTIADLGLRAISNGPGPDTESLSSESQQVLLSMRMDSPAMSRSAWTNASLAILTWARQSHRTAEYEAIRTQLRTHAEGDAAAQDRMTHEEALRCLQRADRPAALALVAGWRPNNSDAYMHVLRGALLAEVSDADEAMTILESAIQTLRRQQRSRPNDPALVSREAWACLVAADIQRARNIRLRFNPTTDIVQPIDTPPPENFDLRLSALVARGYSARAELDAAEARLNAEALPPTDPSARKVGFDLNTYTTQRRFGLPAELRAKLTASFAWLDLLERVGLPPSIENVNFYGDQLLHAAWWARYADRPERSTGLLLRANWQKALEPRDRSTAFHRSGWLQRHEVAAFREEAAAELAEELLQQIVLEFDVPRSATRSEHRVIFLLEVFSRLSIRVQQEGLLRNWGKQLLGIHRKAGFQSSTSIWNASTEAVSRVLEAMQDDAQRSFLLDLFQLPLAPAFAETIRVHDLDNWSNIFKMTRHCAADLCRSVTEEWRAVARDLIHRLRMTPEAEPAKQIWLRLNVLRRLGALTEQDAREIGDILWGRTEPEKWPVIPGHHVGGTLNWPSPNGDAAKELVNRLLGRPLRPFSGGYMTVTLGNGGRSYDIGGLDATVRQLQYALSRTTPSTGQIKTLISRVEEWAGTQLGEVAEDIADDHVRESAASFVNSLDQMLSLCVKTLSERVRTKPVEGLIRRMTAIDVRLRVLPFVRSQLNLALIRCNNPGSDELDDEVRSIIRALTAVDENASLKGFNAAHRLLHDDHPSFQNHRRKVFDAVVACTFALRTPCASYALELLAGLPVPTLRRYLDDRSLLLLDTVLAHLAELLEYRIQSTSGNISEELIPLMRFRAFALAHTLIHHVGCTSDSSHRWLENASSDPLPEVRLHRYRVPLT